MDRNVRSHSTGQNSVGGGYNPVCFFGWRQTNPVKGKVLNRMVSSINFWTRTMRHSREFECREKSHTLGRITSIRNIGGRCRQCQHRSSKSEGNNLAAITLFCGKRYRKLRVWTAEPLLVLRSPAASINRHNVLKEQQR
ncbi:hypothetical protein IW261DRAFT_1419630 [Armillaria novae-zelandiae]|uniref:Uncharacterized protein n=1 Tax=Armillaria novae-zelandiae TaxID=153914 RepID=A0AA39P9U4_9AGAR|nr:hypothetical protein IW261DRAFT_1419630 [Armillaria novae-zelandiae]